LTNGPSTCLVYHQHFRLSTPFFVFFVFFRTSSALTYFSRWVIIYHIWKNRLNPLWKKTFLFLQIFFCPILI